MFQAKQASVSGCLKRNEQLFEDVSSETSNCSRMSRAKRASLTTSASVVIVVAQDSELITTYPKARAQGDDEPALKATMGLTSIRGNSADELQIEIAET